MPSTLPWMIALGASTLLLMLLAAWAYRNRRRRPKPLPTHWALSARPVFTNDERKVYRHLREALPHHIVLAKVPLVRFSQALEPEQKTTGTASSVRFT
jgi:LPXTG-motif cell wall-anchored protein